jgi:hypothetical protein
MKVHELTADLKKFMLAGNATFTLENEETGNRVTYKVVACKGKDNLHFVKVLTGPDNTNDYTYLGCVFERNNFRRTAKSSIGPDAMSHKVFAWLMTVLNKGKALPETVKFYHAGKCCKCGRKLSTPESVTLGIGPECAKMV